MLPMSAKTIEQIAALCADCATCHSECPVYAAELVEPHSPRGKVNLIKALDDGRLRPNRLNRRLLYQCLICGRCQAACPSQVEFDQLMISHRNRLSGGHRIPLPKKLALFFYQGAILNRFLWIPRWLAKTPLRRKYFLPASQRGNLKKIMTPETTEPFDVLLFPGCVLSYFYPRLADQIKSFLEKQGLRVALPRGLACCGFPYLSQGWEKKFQRLRRHNQDRFARFRFRFLVVPCATGAGAFRSYYHLPPTTRVYELTEFIYKFMKKAAVNESFPAQGQAVTYHDPCHSRYSLKINREPRFFLKKLGKKFIDDPEPLCCGFGGIFRLGFGKTSGKILARKREHLADLGAGAVVTSCPGCYLQLKTSLPTPVYFFSEIFE